MRDYDRYFIENKRLREHMNTLRDEKDTSISELNRLKLIYHERVNELNDYCNSKISHIENKLLEILIKLKFIQFELKIQISYYFINQNENNQKLLF